MCSPSLMLTNFINGIYLAGSVFFPCPRPSCFSFFVHLSPPWTSAELTLWLWWGERGAPGKVQVGVCRRKITVSLLWGWGEFLKPPSPGLGTECLWVVPASKAIPHHWGATSLELLTCTSGHWGASEAVWPHWGQCFMFVITYMWVTAAG